MGSLRRKRMGLGVRAAAVCLALSWTGQVHAEPLPASATPTYDWTRDGLVTGAAGAGVLTLAALKGELAPRRCGWCTPPAFDAKLADRLAWRDARLAVRSSDVLAAGVGGGALGLLLARGYRRGDPTSGWANALIVTEATSLAVLLDSGVKYVAARQRPYVRQGHQELASDAYDQNLSFFSQHTTFTFAVAASSTTLLADQGEPSARWYGVAAFGAAGLTGYLRLAGRQHYLSDVLVGAGVGTLIGWAVPHWFHRPIQLGSARVLLLPAPNGIAGVF